MKDYGVMNIARGFFNFQKNAFENSFSTLLDIQERSNELTESLLKENKHISGVGKEKIDEWKNILLKCQSDIKSSVDDGFINLDSYLSDFTKS